VYTRCLFCAGDLGANEAIEVFPVGRRLAYDPDRGRLWVVCPRCARWNLTPLEARWEAIGQAERLYRGARVRANTDQIGLARTRDGTDLVRVGRPTAPELATWRYADVFAGRRRRAVALRAAVLTASAVLAGGLVWGALGAGLGLGTIAWWATNLVNEPGHDAEREEATRRARDDLHATRVVLTRHPVSLTHGAVRRATLAHDGGTLALSFAFGREIRTLVGPRAESAAGAMLAYLNGAGAEREQVDRALGQLVAAGSAAAFLAALGRRERGLRTPAGAATGLSIGIASAPTRLALEMAINDGRERAAMDGELAALEQAWQDAEAIAVIADGLGLPSRVERAFAGLRGRG
jgi:hypothetical protein